MARNGRNGYEPNIGDMTVGDYANGMPNIRIGEMFRSFGRQLPLMIVLFVIGLVPAWYFTKDLKRTFEGVGTIMVLQGTVHTFRDAGSSILQGPEAITEVESAIINNSEVIDNVVAQMVTKYGEGRFNKEAFDKIRAATESGDPIALNDARVQLHKSIESAFWVTPRAKSGVIDIGFKHEDGQIAVDTLNTFINEYMAHRRTIFVDGSADVFRKEAASTEEQLNQVEKDIQNFLRRNGISSFDSEQEGAAERTEALRAEMNETRAQIVEAETALAVVETQLRNTPDVIDEEITDMGSQRVAQAELELKQLLAKYLPTSDPVRAKELEISELKALQQSNGGNPIGRRTVGPNPTYQSLLDRRNELQSTADSLREKEFTVQQLLNSNDAKVRKLQNLLPEYSNLLRERATLDQSLRSVNTKLQDAIVAQEQAEAVNTENVKIIAWASLPRKGRNMQKIMFALIMLGWGFTLFMIALLRVFLDPRLYTDPTRRMRPPSQNFNEYASDEWGRDVPYRSPHQPYIPEPVPARPAAAHYQDPYASPEPYAASAETAAPYQTAAPYATGATAVAYDPTQNPYAPPQVQAHPPGTGQLPSSEFDN